MGGSECLTEICSGMCSGNLGRWQLCQETSLILFQSGFNAVSGRPYSQSWYVCTMLCRYYFSCQQHVCAVISCYSFCDTGNFKLESFGSIPLCIDKIYVSV
jgi:hypothetical protein